MNGIPDLGGMQGHGPVQVEANEPVFHEDWERRVFAVNILSVGTGFFNIDESRHGIERMPPAAYLETSYYEHWLHALELLLVEKGIIGKDELARRIAEVEQGRHA
jgi:nitrile hydratase subunit beta